MVRGESVVVTLASTWSFRPTDSVSAISGLETVTRWIEGPTRSVKGALTRRTHTASQVKK